MAKTKTVLNYRVLIEQDEDGVFVASVPSLQGCYTEGNTYEDVLTNIKDVLKLHLKERSSYNIDDSNTKFIGVKNISIQHGSFTHT